VRRTIVILDTIRMASENNTFA